VKKKSAAKSYFKLESLHSWGETPVSFCCPY